MRGLAMAMCNGNGVEGVLLGAENWSQIRYHKIMEEEAKKVMRSI